MWYLKWSSELQVHFRGIIKWMEQERKATNHIKTTAQRSQQNSFRERQSGCKERVEWSGQDM